MKYLLDTHVLLWLAADNPSLSKWVRETFQDEKAEFVLSAASVWEMAVKISLGKLTLPCKLQEFVDDEVIGNQIALLPIKPVHTYQLEALPFIHRDPFDRLMICQARYEGLTLVSKDSILRKYEVDVAWESA